MVLVDTNILLHAVNADSPECARAGAALEALVNGREQWALSWGIVYEFLRVATHPRIFAHPLRAEQAHAYVAEWIAADNCTLIAESAYHHQVLSDSLAEVARLAGNILHDFHHAVLMREHGIREILTLDRDFRAFPWVAIRPLAEG